MRPGRASGQLVEQNTMCFARASISKESSSVPIVTDLSQKRFRGSGKSKVKSVPLELPHQAGCNGSSGWLAFMTFLPYGACHFLSAKTPLVSFTRSPRRIVSSLRCR